MFGEFNSKDELGVVIIPSVKYKVPFTVNGLIKSNCPPALNISTLERVLLEVVPPNVCVVPTPLNATNPLLLTIVPLLVKLPLMSISVDGKVTVLELFIIKLLKAVIEAPLIVEVAEPPGAPATINVTSLLLEKKLPLLVQSPETLKLPRVA